MTIQVSTADRRLWTLMQTGSPLSPFAAEPARIPDLVLLKCIGRGAFGDVWLARTVMGTYRAVKIVHRHAFTDPHPYEREFEGIRRFEPVSRRHESQVAVLHVGRNDEAGYFYYVMELADDAAIDAQSPADEDREPGWGTPSEPTIDPERYVSKTLKHELSRRGRFSVTETLRIGLSLTTALEHLHSHGLVHRDIKPSNIIFVQGLPKLADVGLIATVDATRSVAGTPGYIPPEGPGQPAGDLYSLGKVLYEMGTGRDRGEFPALEPALLESAERESLLELNAVLVKACQAEARRRYRTAAEMHADLAMIRSGKSVRRSRWLERRQATMIRALLITAGVAILAFGGFLVQSKVAERLRQQEIETRQALRRAEAEAYAGDMIEASRALDEDKLGLAVGALARNHSATNRAGLRGWEWRYLWAQCRGDQVGVLGESGEGVTTSGALAFFALSPDGRLLASNTPDGWLEIWDLVTTQRLDRLPSSAQPHAFSPDGKWLATVQDQSEIRLWNTETWEERDSILITNGIKVHTVCFSPDGQILAAANAGDLGLWRMDPLREVDPLETTPIGPQSGRHWCAFSPDGSIVAYAPATSRDVQIVALADARTGAVRQQIGSFGRQTVRTLAFSPDGHWLALGRRIGDIDLYRKTDEGFEKVETLRGHTADIMSMVFEPNGLILATASFDQTIRLWDTGTWQQTNKLRGHAGPIWDVMFWPGKNRVISASYDGQRYVWSTRPSSRVADTQPHPPGSDVFGMSLDPQGETLCFLRTNETCSLWDPAFLSETTRFPLPIAFSNVVASALGPGGRTLALALRDHTIRLWDTSQLKEIGSTDTDGPMSHLRFSHEGRYLAGTGQGSSARYGGQGLWVWKTEAAATRPVASLPDIVLVGWNPLEFTRDERQLVLGFREGVVKRVGLWDFGGLGELHPLEGGDQAVAAVGSSPDGRTVVAVGSNRNAATVTLWDASTRKRLPVQGRANAYFMSVAFSPDGRRVFTGDLWGDIGVWDVGTGRELMRLDGSGNPFVLRFLGDRNTVFAAGFSGMHVWRAPTFAEIEAAERERSLVSAAVWQHE